MVLQSSNTITRMAKLRIRETGLFTFNTITLICLFSYYTYGVRHNRNYGLLLFILLLLLVFVTSDFKNSSKFITIGFSDGYFKGIDTYRIKFMAVFPVIIIHHKVGINHFSIS